jgi:hypothetical protein
VDEEGWKFPDTLHWPQLHGDLSGSILEEDRYFLDVIRDGRKIISTGEDGRKALRVVLAAKESYTRDLPVNM